MGKLKRISSLFIVFLLIFSCSFSSYADVASGSNATDSNAIMTLDLDDEDYGISTLSSVGTVTNTIDWNGSYMQVGIWDKTLKLLNIAYIKNTNVSTSEFSNSYSLDGTVWDDSKYVVTRVGFQLGKDSLPNPGTYLFSCDMSSAFSYSISNATLWTQKDYTNASAASGSIPVSDYSASSGDFYCPPFGIQLTNVNRFVFFYNIAAEDGIRNVSVTGHVNFTPTTGSYGSTAGTNTSTEDYQSEVSSSISNISSSLESVDENLQYISSSQNLIIQGIDNVIMHISDQLYAYWDQHFNLIHLPEMDKMDEIIAAIRKVANDVDMSQVVDTIEDTTDEQIANDNANTTKIEEAVKAHGNFIIDGLKGLFIPSDEYFKSYFDDLYEYFSDRFGFLSFPIDLLSRLIDLFVNSSDVDCVLTLPGFEISGEQVWTDQSFNLTEFMETNFSFVLTAIRTVTSIYLIMAFVDLCREKWNEVMSN